MIPILAAAENCTTEIDVLLVNPKDSFQSPVDMSSVTTLSYAMRMLSVQFDSKVDSDLELIRKMRPDVSELIF